MAERVLIGASVRSAITAHVRAAPKTETGGILIGRDAGAGTLDITFASGPGPRAVRRMHYFSRDTAFLQGSLTAKSHAPTAPSNMSGNGTCTPPSTRRRASSTGARSGVSRAAGTIQRTGPSS
jgi:hypothetical protein